MLIPAGALIVLCSLMEWKCHQPDHLQTICTLLQHVITGFFTGWMLFQMPNQQCQEHWRQWKSARSKYDNTTV